MPPLRVISFNANGIRSAIKKGFFSWLTKQNADLVCLQETKAQEHQLKEAAFCPKDYHCFYFDAEKKGYSGVAIYSKKEPDEIITGLGWKEADTEGRYIEARFKNLSLVSLYLPSGTSGDLRQNVKYDFMDRFRKYLGKIKNNKREYIICGDWNIAHKEIDLKNWKANQTSSGFLPEERAWLDELLTKAGFVDGFRVVNQEPEQYTWWSMRSLTAWEKNVGWRIDYQIVTPGLKNKILAAEIYRGEKFSDHAPLVMDYSLSI